MKSSRRLFMKEAGRASLWVFTSCGWSSLAAFADVEPTPPDSAGPYYVAGAPVKTDLREADQDGRALRVSGRVTSLQGLPLQNAGMEIWHSEADGRYDMAGFRYRATIPVLPSGDYRFLTHFPGHYSGRPQHIHYRITRAGHEPLFTQLYFAEDPLFKSRPVGGFFRLPDRRLIRPVEETPAEAAVFFHIALKQS